LGQPRAARLTKHDPRPGPPTAPTPTPPTAPTPPTQPTPAPPGADVYSYAGDEDDMVLDPHLDKHLRHWGINMMTVGGGGRGGGWGGGGWANVLRRPS
jgi:hypothetical protein